MKNTTGEVKKLTLNNQVCLHKNESEKSFTDCTSLYHLHVNNQQNNSSFLGKYWCQVINTTADPDQPLMRSNVFTLLPPDNYNGSRCANNFQLIDNVTCADLIKQSTIPQSTMATTDFPRAHSPSNNLNGQLFYNYIVIDPGVTQTKQGLKQLLN